jgi:hypothetical protein
MRIAMFFKLMIAALCVSLLSFALVPGMGPVEALKAMAFGTVLSIGITAFYPEFRGIRAGDTVSVVNDSNIPSIIGRLGVAAASARKNQQLKITLPNGNEVIGVVESYTGLISPPKIRIIYEEKLVE